MAITQFNTFVLKAGKLQSTKAMGLTHASGLV